MKDSRYDTRDEGRLKDSILRGEQKERYALEVFCKHYEKKYKCSIITSFFGTRGDFIPDVNEVNIKPDFSITFQGGPLEGEHYIEVQTSKINAKTFHIKLSKFNMLIDSNALLLHMNGVHTSNECYTILTHIRLKELYKKAKETYGIVDFPYSGNKKALRIETNWIPVWIYPNRIKPKKNRSLL